jgi:hypothetical protein
VEEKERPWLLPVTMPKSQAVLRALTRALFNPEVTRASLLFVFNFKTEEEESCSVIMTCEMQDEVN